MCFAEIEILVGASDADATRTAYAAFEPRGCECAFCRNFRAQTNGVPESIQLLLQKMGIDPAKPVEIVDYGKCNDGGRLYEVEWAFLPDADHTCDRLVTARCDGCKVSMFKGGIPNEFSHASNRCSLSVLMSNVPWVLSEAEPPDNRQR